MSSSIVLPTTFYRVLRGKGTILRFKTPKFSPNSNTTLGMSLGNSIVFSLVA